MAGLETSSSRLAVDVGPLFGVRVDRDGGGWLANRVAVVVQRTSSGDGVPPCWQAEHKCASRISGGGQDASWSVRYDRACQRSRLTRRGSSHQVKVSGQHPRRMMGGVAGAGCKNDHAKASCQTHRASGADVHDCLTLRMAG